MLSLSSFDTDRPIGHTESQSLSRGPVPGPPDATLHPSEQHAGHDDDSKVRVRCLRKIVPHSHLPVCR